MVQYTLPVLPTGLTSQGLNLLQNALTNGVNIGIVNVMTMDYGDGSAPDPDGQMGEYGIEAMVHDPLGDPHQAREEYGLDIASLDRFTNLDALFLAVAHTEYVSNLDSIFARVRDGGVLIDVKSVITGIKPPRGIRLWSL